MSDLAIRIEGIGKQYRIGSLLDTNRTLRDALLDGLSAPTRYAGKLLRREALKRQRETFWALKDVSFDVHHGEVVGIIGSNGAGKSTLLKVLSRITEPTEGYAEITGRVRALLEVGTGFHPELTGRENVFLNGAILGMHKAEIKRKFDEIVAFSGIEQFIDTPVKRYSSGMYVRLAFAVAAHLEPEILVIDEVLSVGDVAFQKKCLEKIDDVSRGGRTVLFVSHNMAAVEHLCQRCVLLRGGRIEYLGNPKECVERYIHSSLTHESEESSGMIDLTNRPRRPEFQQPWLQRLEAYTGKTPLRRGLPMGAGVRFKVTFTLWRPASDFHINLMFDNRLGQTVFVASSLFEPNRVFEERVGEQTFVCDFPCFPFVPGEYIVRTSLDFGKRPVDEVENAMKLTVVQSDWYGTGRRPWDGAVVLEQHWKLL